MGHQDLKSRVSALQSKPENQFCCDCSDKRPTYAAIIAPPPGATKTLGAFVCYQCSAAHKLLGKEICKVRNASVDDWKERDVVALESGGNKKVTAIFEGKINFDTPKPDARSSASTRETFIRAKYEERKYYNEASMAKEEKTKPKALGGLALKASKADTAAKLQLDRQALGYDDEEPVAAAPLPRRSQRRASMTMAVSSSTHRLSTTKLQAESSDDDDANEFGGDGDDNDEWWEPFDAGDATANGFDDVNGFGSDDPFFTIPATEAGEAFPGTTSKPKSSSRLVNGDSPKSESGKRRGAGRSSSQHSTDGEGGGVTSRRRCPPVRGASRRNLIRGGDNDLAGEHARLGYGDADDMVDPIKPQSRRGARRASLGMSSHSTDSGDSFGGQAPPRSSRKLDALGGGSSHVPKSSRRLGGGKKKDPLSVSFHDTDLDCGAEEAERERLGYGDTEGGSAANRRMAARQASLGISTHSADGAEHPAPKTSRQAPRRVASSDGAHGLLGYDDPDGGSSPKPPSMRRKPGRRTANDGSSESGPRSSRALGGKDVGPRRGAVRRSSLGMSNHNSTDGEELGISSKSNSSRGGGDKSSKTRRNRSSTQGPSSLRNLPGKGGKSTGDADETVTTVSSDDSAGSVSEKVDPSTLKPKSSGNLLLGALYGDGPVAAPVATPTTQRRRPNRRGSCCV